MDELQAILFFSRRGKLLCEDQLTAEARPLVVSDFVVWLLDISMPFLDLATHRELALQVQRLHVARASQLPIADAVWEQSRASYLAASTLWPAEWLSIGSMPGMPAIGHGVAATSLGTGRGAREIAENHHPFSAAHPDLQKLLNKLAKPWFPQQFWPAWQQLLITRLDVACLLYRTPRSSEELALQMGARCGGDLGPYYDWLTEGGESAHGTLRPWLEWTDDSTSFSPHSASG